MSFFTDKHERPRFSSASHDSDEENEKEEEFGGIQFSDSSEPQKAFGSHGSQEFTRSMSFQDNNKNRDQRESQVLPSFSNRIDSSKNHLTKSTNHNDLDSSQRTVLPISSNQGALFQKKTFSQPSASAFSGKKLESSFFSKTKIAAPGEQKPLSSGPLLTTKFNPRPQPQSSESDSVTGHKSGQEPNTQRLPMTAQRHDNSSVPSRPQLTHRTPLTSRQLNGDNGYSSVRAEPSQPVATEKEHKPRQTNSLEKIIPKDSVAGQPSRISTPEDCGVKPTSTVESTKTDSALEMASEPQSTDVTRGTVDARNTSTTASIAADNSQSIARVSPLPPPCSLSQVEGAAVSKDIAAACTAVNDRVDALYVSMDAMRVQSESLRSDTAEMDLVMAEQSCKLLAVDPIYSVAPELLKLQSSILRMREGLRELQILQGEY